MSSILSLILLFLLYGQQLRNQAQIRLIVHSSCYIYFPVADMEAGLPDVAGDDSGGAWHHSQLVERASQPHYNVSWLPPAAPAVPGLSGASTAAHPSPCGPGGWRGEHALASVRHRLASVSTPSSVRQLRSDLLCTPQSSSWALATTRHMPQQIPTNSLA